MRKTTIIIPTYNEKENVENIIRGVAATLPEATILIVDDNSPDGTRDIVERLQKEFLQVKTLYRKGKEGLGKAYLHAFNEVLKDNALDTVILMDADYSHDPVELPKMIALRDEYDVIIGSRYIAGGKTIGWELWRRLLSFWGNFYARTVTQIPAKDVTAGFACISTKFLRKVDPASIDASGYAFTIELKYTLWKLGAQIKEIPITFKNRTGGESKISNHIISEGIKAPWKIICKK